MFRLLISFLLLSTISFAQEKSYYALTIPGQPVKQGQTITINYTPAKTNLAKASGDISATAVLYTKGSANGYDISLKPGKRGVYTGSVTISDSSDAVAFQFKRGKANDNNEGNGYFFPVADASGNLAPNSNFSLAMIVGGDYFAGVESPKAELSKTYYTRWMEDNRTEKTLGDRLRVATMSNDTATVCSLVENYASYATATEGEFNSLGFYATQFCKKPELAKKITEYAQAKFPEGNWRNSPWIMNTRGAKTAAEKMVWYNAYNLAFPKAKDDDKSAAKTQILPLVIRAAAQQLDLATFEKGMTELAKLEKREMERAGMLNTFAWAAAEKDTLLEKATELSKQSLDIIEKEKVEMAAKAPYWSPAQYTEQLNSNYGMYADTYGYLLMKQGRDDSAYAYLDHATRINYYSSADVNDRLLQSMEKTKTPKEIVGRIETIILGGGYKAETMQDRYLKYAQQAGMGAPQANLEKVLATAKDIKYGEYKAKMVNKDPVNFELKDINGIPVNLAGLKGKVVVIDFWATWCGPCLASFPGMQKAVDATKNDPEVAMLFVNTWQREEDKLANAKDFMAKNPNYTFHVVMDDKDEMITDYGVSGIPTKFVLDKNGRIRFVSVGYNGDTDKTRDEMLMMIDLAKDAK